MIVSRKADCRLLPVGWCHCASNILLGHVRQQCSFCAFHTAAALHLGYLQSATLPVPCRIRNQIDNLLASDRALSLVVAIETALEDKRFEVIKYIVQTCQTFSDFNETLCSCSGHSIWSCP